MDKLTLIIGPGGVGKSSAIKMIPNCEKLLTYKLDDVLKGLNAESGISTYFGKIGNIEFFIKSIEGIERIREDNPFKQTLIDIGAGSFDWEECVDAYLKYQIISLTGDKEILYNRIKSRPSENRTFEEYVDSEFKPHKVKLYENAKLNINTSNLSENEVAQRITDFLKISNLEQ
jgi:shikimate kinase